jgi:hypothetical protein
MFIRVSNPLSHIDPNGHTIELSDEATDEQRRQYEEAIRYLRTSETGNELINTLEKAPEVITITFNNNMDAFYIPAIRTIEWDSTAGLLLGNQEHVVSPAIILAHEMGHVAQHLDGRYAAFWEKYGENHMIVVMEADNLIASEHPIATELGEFLRSDYLNVKGMFRVEKPTDGGTYSKVSHSWWKFWHWFDRKEFHNLNEFSLAFPQALDQCLE